jgi:hypothetical protein
MYPAQSTYADSIKESDLVLPPDATPEQRRVVAVATAEMREMFADIDLAPEEARDVVSWAKEIAATPPTPEQEKQTQGEAIARVLRRNGGDEEATKADIILAQRLVARDPRIGRLLDVTRLGNDPRVIEVLIQKARQERIKGRL